MPFTPVVAPERSRRPSTRMVLSLLASPAGNLSARFSLGAVAALEGLTAVRPLTGSMLAGSGDHAGMIAFALDPEGKKVGASGGYPAVLAFAASSQDDSEVYASVKYSLELVKEPFVGFIGTPIVEAEAAPSA